MNPGWTCPAAEATKNIEPRQSRRAGDFEKKLGPTGEQRLKTPHRENFSNRSKINFHDNPVRPIGKGK